MSGLPFEVAETLRANYDLEPSGSEPLTAGWDVHVESWLIQSDLGPLVVRRDRSLTVASANWLGEVLDVAHPFAAALGLLLSPFGEHASQTIVFVLGFAALAASRKTSASRAPRRSRAAG